MFHTLGTAKMGKIRPLTAAIALMFCAFSPITSHAAEDPAPDEMNIYPFGISGDETNAKAVSGDGTTVGGYTLSTEEGAVKLGFTRVDGTTTDLPVQDSGKDSYVFDINGDGSVVVGQAGFTDLRARAFRLKDGAMVDLGSFISGGISRADAVNEDGSVVVGYSEDYFPAASRGFRAFRWEEGGEMIYLDKDNLTLDDNDYSYAKGVSADGTVVVGNVTEYDEEDNASRSAFRWVGTRDGGVMTLLKPVSETEYGKSSASDVSANGTVVVGQSTFVLADSSVPELAFRWKEGGDNPNSGGGTMTSLGALAGDTVSNASAVNAAGTVVVGYSAVSGANDSERRGFIWEENDAAGMQTIENWLTASGVAVNLSAVSVKTAEDVSDDGSVVVGQLSDNTAYLARGKAGLITIPEFTDGLAGFANMPAEAVGEARTIMNGAHSQPMRGLLTQGKQSVWVTGDVGSTQEGNEDGTVATGEIGYAYGVNDDVMVKVALGRTYENQDAMLGGYGKTDGTYIIPEVIIKLSDTPLYATLSGYYNSGDGEMKRGYDNAGNTDYSFGKTDIDTVALKARIDWLNAFKSGNSAFTPYASISWYKSDMDAYTETGGGFPVQWDAREEESTEARIGLDLTHTLSASSTFLGRAEYVHRFDDQSSGATGQIIGATGFALDGQAYEQNWLRLGVGVEGELGDGVANVMLNGTTLDEGTKYWLSATYRVTF